MVDDFRLQSFTVGPMPVVNSYMERLGIGNILGRHISRDGEIPPSDMLLILLRNLVMGREPIYGIHEWASRIHPHLLGLNEEDVYRINDDRIGRALDSLFLADRASMLTEIVISALHGFHISMDRVHNDTTTITLSGGYSDADGTPVKGKPTPSVTYGHNKDHRPDLKQLLLSLTVSSDGSVPVHYRTFDGNTQDSDTHMEVWNSVRSIVGSGDFLYVADSKLCVSSMMRYISSQGGKFITVLPATRSEDAWFRSYMQDHEISWARAEVNCSDDAFGVFESPLPSSEGFRIVWVWSSFKERRDRESRERSIEKAMAAMDLLNRKLSGRTRIRSVEGVAKLADEIIGPVKRYLAYRIHESDEEKFRQSRRGRPAPGTEYVRTIRKRFSVTLDPVKENISFDARCDGIFPLITNTDLSGEKVLEDYKYQPMLEKRNEQLKSVYSIMPVYLKRIDRIEAFMFMFFTAMLIQALIERDVRTAMLISGVDALPIYHEDKECESPTTDRIFSVFDGVQLHRLYSSKDLIKTFRPELTERQRKLLSLMNVSPESYEIRD